MKNEGCIKGLLAGYCAIDEVGKELRKEFGRRNIYFSGDCNNLAETLTAQLKLSGISTIDLTPLSFEEAMKILQEA